MDPLLIARLLWFRRLLALRSDWSKSDLKVFQSSQLQKLRNFASRFSPFYRRFHHGFETAPLASLPALSKAVLMENFDSLVTDRAIKLADVEAHMDRPDSTRLFQARYRVASTSGTTGRRGIFLFNPVEWVWIMASYARAGAWAGVSAGLLPVLRLAVITTRTPWHQSALVGATLKSRFVPTLRLDATDPLESLVQRLNDFQPSLIVGYPSVIRLLAFEQEAGRLAILPKAVLTGAEVSTHDDREIIHKIWGVLPFDIYGATETAGIASECPRHEGLHVYEDLVLIENVDDQNLPVPLGEFGAKLLVTVLFSRTLPLIRYELTDSVRLSGQDCSCGLPFPMIEEIQGRIEDILRLPGASGPVIIHPNVFHNHLELLPAREWQVVQDGPGSIRILAAGLPKEFNTVEILERLGNDLSSRGARLSSLQWEMVEAVPKGPNGKTPLIRKEKC